MSFFFLQNVFFIFQKTVFDHPSLLFPIFRFTKSQLFSLTTIFVIRNEKKSKGADSLPMVRAHRNVTELVQRAQTSTTSSEDEAWMAVYEELLHEHPDCCAKREEDPCCVMNTVHEHLSFQKCTAEHVARKLFAQSLLI